MNDLIIAYTRAQAIADGTLVDVSKVAGEAGFRYPVAITRTVFERYVRVPNGVSCQDEDGRLWDILWMLSWAVRRARGSQTEVPFTLHVAQVEGQTILVDLKSVCGPGDNAEPVITIMLPDED